MECGSWLHKANVGAFPSVYDPSLGILRTHQNCTVESVHIALPALRKLFLNAELAFDGEPYTAWAEQKWNDGTLLWICAAYLALCFALRPMLMAAKIRYRLQKELIVWNLLLAAFSLAGALRLVPHLLYLIGSRGFYGSLCAPATPACGSGPAGVWVMLFVFSKIPELMDTVFIVLRGKPLIFLHWYHHVTVLLYTWHCYATRASPGLYFAAMNYTVHAVMYFYYGLQAAGAKPKWGAIVTTMQIAQMFAGMAIVAATVVYQQQGLACDVMPSNTQGGALIYASYAALFLWFAWGRYCVRPKTAAGEAGKEE